MKESSMKSNKSKYKKLILLVKQLASYAKKNVPSSFSEKDNHELVSEVDAYIEIKLKEFLKESFPEEKVWGEESGGDEGGWLIDPIDGTGQYLHGVPLSSISIVRILDETSVFAIVANIMTGEIFVAEKGKGARLITGKTEVELKFKQNVSVDRTILSWDHVIKDKTEASWLHVCYQRSVEEFLKTRMLGSGALSLCYLSRNYFQIFIKSIRKTKEKADIFAGLLIAEESGAKLEVIRYQDMDFYLVGTETAIDTAKSKILF